MKFILGKKIEMTQIFKDSGEAVPVTKIQAGPCAVVQVKSDEKDGYTAIQFGYGEKKEKNINKPQLKHMKGAGKGNFRYLREMKMSQMNTNDDTNGHELKRGDVINVSNFKEGDEVQVTGTSKGKGFQGVVKRHGFHGSLATHGHKDQVRMPGSIGATGPAHVFKGTKMGGHMGNEQVTMKNLEVVKVDADNNILYIKGAIPGARNGLVVVQGEGELKPVESQKSEEVEGDKKVESQKNNKTIKQESVPEVTEKVSSPDVIGITEDKNKNESEKEQTK